MKVLIGKKLKNLRTHKFMSQELLADELNMSQSAYARMESGQSNSWVNYIEPICKIFDIAAHELLMSNDTATTSKVVSAKLSEKLIEQYELRLQEKNDMIALLKTQLKK